MTRFIDRALRLAALVVFGLCAGAGLAARAGEKSASPKLALGVPATFFKGLPPELAKSLTGPLKTLIESQTGASIELVMGDDHEALGQHLHEGKTQVAVMHGFEFAWLREKYPDLKPLVTVVGDPRQLRAYLVTPRDGKAKCVDDLGGTKLVLPPMWKQHCRLFLEKHCRELGKKPEDHFSETKAVKQLDQALDAVAYSKADATVIDEEAMDWYKKNRPTRFNMLKVVAESEPFPATVIVYREGRLTEGVLKTLREGLLATNRTTEGKALLALCRIAAFEAVPAGYDKDLEGIRAAYPAPGSGDK